MFVGIDVYLRDFIETIFTNPTVCFYVVELILGLLILGYCIFTLSKKQSFENNCQAPKKENWYVIFFIGAGWTLGNVPTALPYIAFVGKMLEMKLELLSALPCFVLYNLLYGFYQEKISGKLIVINNFMNKANKFIIVGFSGIFSLLLLIDAILYFLGYPIQW